MTAQRSVSARSIRVSIMPDLCCAGWTVCASTGDDASKVAITMRVFTFLTPVGPDMWSVAPPRCRRLAAACPRLAWSRKSEAAQQFTAEAHAAAECGNGGWLARCPPRTTRPPPRKCPPLRCLRNFKLRARDPSPLATFFRKNVPTATISGKRLSG